MSGANGKANGKANAKETTTKDVMDKVADAKAATEKRAAAEAAAKKNPPKAMKRIEKRDMKKHFWIQLSDKELAKLGTDSGKLRGKINIRKDKFDDMKKKESAEIKELETELAGMLHTLGTGKEQREIECIEVKDFGKKEVRYMAGKKVLQSRNMTGEELQTAMVFNKTQKIVDKASSDAAVEQKLRKEATNFKEGKKKGNGKTGQSSARA